MYNFERNWKLFTGSKNQTSKTYGFVRCTNVEYIGPILFIATLKLYINYAWLIIVR